MACSPETLERSPGLVARRTTAADPGPVGVRQSSGAIGPDEYSGLLAGRTPLTKTATTLAVLAKFTIVPIAVAQGCTSHSFGARGSNLGLREAADLPLWPALR